MSAFRCFLSLLNACQKKKKLNEIYVNNMMSSRNVHPSARIDQRFVCSVHYYYRLQIGILTTKNEEI